MNGKTGEVLRYVIGLVVAALVAYYTAIGTLRESDANLHGRIAVIEQREQSRFEEVQRSLSRIERAVERIEADGVDRRTGEPLNLQRSFER